MAERGLELAHTTIMRWVQRYVPEFEKSWAHYARKVGRSWRVDETYLKVRRMGLSLPCRGQGGQYRRLPAESQRETLRRPRRSSARRSAPTGVLPLALRWMAMPHRIEQCARCRAKTGYGSTPSCDHRNT
jgi:hypothetical protein